MRFLMLTFAMAALALACEKSAPLSSGTTNLAPGPATARPASAAAPQAPASAANAASPADTVSAASREAGREPADVARAVAEPEYPSDEGNGEPMDDVDDEVPATDRSGVDEAPSGPIDDSEGADIELHE